MDSVKWYFRPWAVIVAILVAGPFALPLVWFNPSFRTTMKILITIAVLAATAWILMASAELYKTLLKDMQDLQRVMR